MPNRAILSFAKPMKDGSLDDVLNVLDAHCHPCILIGRYALMDERGSVTGLGVYAI